MLRDKIADILAQHETLDKEAPYRVMPSDSPEWCKIKAMRILALIDAQRCVWTRDRENKVNTECGRSFYCPFILDNPQFQTEPYCSGCGHRIEVKEGEDG